ncbi:MAG: hypothetical protein COB08_016510 [Rhodobacteraceae bacterium]|nr:hypothetical protein [Paracoccaceae bacterium]
MKNYLKSGLTLGLTAIGGAAMAAGSGTGIESGFTEIGTDLNTLLGGAGGFIIVLISLGMGALMIGIGRGWGAAVGAFAVAMFLGYGVSALTGISGVSASTELLTAQCVHEAQADMEVLTAI